MELAFTLLVHPIKPTYFMHVCYAIPSLCKLPFQIQLCNPSTYSPIRICLFEFVFVYSNQDHKTSSQR